MVDNLDLIRSVAQPNNLDLIRGVVNTPETETQSVYDFSSGRSVTHPMDINPEEALFLDKVQNAGEKIGDYLGFIKVNAIDGLKNFYKGSLAGGSSAVSSTASGLLTEYADLYKEIEDEGIKAYNLFLPTSKGAISRNIFISNLLGGDKPDTKRSQILSKIDEIRNRNIDFIEYNSLQSPKDSGFQKFMYDLGGGSFSVGVVIGTTAITKNPLLGATLMSIAAKASAYEEMVESGEVTAVNARKLSDLRGVLSGIINYAGGNYFLSALKSHKGISKIVAIAAEEFMRESSDQAVEEIMLKATGVRDTDIKEGISNALYAGIIGSIWGAGVGGFSNGINKVMGKVNLDATSSKRLENILNEKLPDIEEAVLDILSKEASDASAPPNKNYKKLADMVQKVIEGGDIINDTKQMIQESTDITLEEKQSLINLIDNPVISDSIIGEKQTILDNDILNIDSQIEALENDIINRTQDNKPTKALENKIDKLIDKRDSLMQRRMSLPEVSASSKVQIREQKLQKLGVKVRDESIKNINRSFVEAKKLAIKDIKKAQEIVIDALNNSGLSKAGKAKFIEAIKNINMDNIGKKLPELQSKISRAADLEVRNNITKVAKNLISKTKPKVVDGKLTGKMDADHQAIADNIRDLFSLSKDQAREKLINNINGIMQSGSSGTSDVILENRILYFISDGMKTSEMLSTLLELDSFINEGKNIRKNYESKLEARVERDVNNVIDFIGTRDEVNGFVRESFNDAINIVAKGFNNWAGTFRNKLQYIFSSSDKSVTEFLDTIASLKDENIAFNIGKQSAVKGLTARMIDKSKLTEKQLMNKLLKDSTDVLDLGTFLHSDGKIRRIKMSKAEIRKKLMESLDNNLEEILYHRDGNAYTDEIMTAFRDSLDNSDMMIIEAQLDFYKDYYKRINKKYREITGVDLPFNDFYSPISRMHDATSEINEFLTGIVYRGGVTPKGLKMRKETISPIDVVGDFDVFMNHTQQMEYWLAMVDKATHLKKVFGDLKVKKSIIDNLGKDWLASIDQDIDYFLHKGQMTGLLGQNIFKTLLRNFGFAQLALKPQIGLKQLTSFPIYVQDVKVSDFVAGLADFAINPKNAMEVLKQSEFWKLRGLNIDKDFQNIISDKSKLNVMGRNPKLLRTMMTFISLGDKGAISIGGYAHYYAKIKAGFSHEQALSSMELVTTRTQQSTDVDQFSQLQQRNDFVSQLITQFMSSPNALVRAEYSALVEFSRGRISGEEFAKQFITLHMVIPTIFQFVANGFKWDNEDQLRASIIGMLNGIFIIGDVIEALVSMVLSDKSEFFELNIRHPMDFINNLGGVIKDIKRGKWQDIDIEDFLEGSKAVNRALKSASDLSGVPINTLYNQLVGANAVVDGEVVNGLSLLLGYSPYIVEKRGE